MIFKGWKTTSTTVDYGDDLARVADTGSEGAIQSETAAATAVTGPGQCQCQLELELRFHLNLNLKFRLIQLPLALALAVTQSLSTRRQFNLKFFSSSL